MNLSEYNKTITVIVGEIVTWLTLVVTSDAKNVTSSEWLAGAIGLATAFGVYQVRNAS